ncbi:MAG TPA: glycosyltransferase family 39 protein, partial [Patescibacteria group bacterium]|nr:glycosyltransferase family 39 protein [Patescibacteria group bacterium]
MFKIKFNRNSLIILGIVLLAAFLRLYRISDYMTFLGDEGRDVLVAKGILEGNLTLLGPRASAGDFFLGPIYYYFMAPFLWLFRLDPVGPAVMVALIGIATVYLVYKVSKEFFGFKAAVFASALYAVSPLVIAYSRSSWNPNPMPFVSLLTLYLSYKAVVAPSFKKNLFIGILLGIAIQLHYLSVFLIIIVLFFILFANKYQKIVFRKTLNSYFQIFIGFLIGFSPFLAFEARHGFPNTKTIINFIFSNTFQKGYGDNVSFVEVVKDVFFRLFGRLVTRFPPREQLGLFDQRIISLWQIGTLLLGLEAIFNIFKIKNKLVAILFLTWIFFGIVLFGFYKKPIYDYYLGFMFPLPFILIGNFLSNFPHKHSKTFWGKILAFGIFLLLFIYNLYG